jgi:hypothetical protein
MNQENSTPTEVFNVFMIARRNGDIETMKSILTESALSTIKSLSINQELSFSEAVNAFGNRFYGLYNNKNLTETHTGRFVVVEVKNSISGEVSKFTFLRENGVWKLALDLEIEDEEQSLSEILKMLFVCMKNVFWRFVKQK